MTQQTATPTSIIHNAINLRKDPAHHLEQIDLCCTAVESITQDYTPHEQTMLSHLRGIGEHSSGRTVEEAATTAIDLLADVLWRVQTLESAEIRQYLAERRIEQAAEQRKLGYETV